MWKNDKLDDVHLKLLDQNIIAIGGEIDVDLALFVREALLRLMGRGSPSIKVIISSQGGDVDCGLIIYDLLRSYEGETTGIVHGLASSMAVTILQACSKRVAMLHASILIHHISHGEVKLDVLRDPDALAKIRKNLEEQQAMLDEILAARTKRNLAEIKAACAKDQKMSAKEALIFGLIDEVL